MIEDIIEKVTIPQRQAENDPQYHARAEEVQELKNLVLQLTETVNQLKATTHRPPEPPGPPPGYKPKEVKQEEGAHCRR